MADSIEYQAKPIRSGNSYCFTIPKALFRVGMIKENKIYKVTIEEVL